MVQISGGWGRGEVTHLCGLYFMVSLGDKPRAGASFVLSTLVSPVVDTFDYQDPLRCKTRANTSVHIGTV